jgi:16S rRNA (guanine527-N7)-methyltransferase
MNAEEFIALLRKDIPLTPVQQERFRALDGLYREWNARINVISRKDIDALYDHHILHSVALARYLQTTGGLWEQFAAARVLDLGTGGGLPGIPLAILFPETRFTLCDSVGKKTLVAKAVAEALDLDNVVVVNARAETLGEPFDFVVSRAVASLSDLYPWVKGRFSRGILCLKGGDVVEEIAEVMQRQRLSPGSVHTWPLSSWLSDPYYEGKWVIHLEK